MGLPRGLGRPRHPDGRVGWVLGGRWSLRLFQGPASLTVNQLKKKNLKHKNVGLGEFDPSKPKWEGFPGGSVVKIRRPARQTQVWFLGKENPLEEEMAIHSSVLAWEIPWTDVPGGLWSMTSKSRTWLSNWARTHTNQSDLGRETLEGESQAVTEKAVSPQNWR